MNMNSELVGRITGGAATVATTASSVVTIIGTLSIFAWLGRAEALTAWHQEFIPMAPATAMCFGALGAALLSRTTLPMRASCSLCAAGVAVCLIVAGQALVTFLTGLRPLLDLEPYLVSNAGTFGHVPVGRMSPITAVGLVLAAGSMWFATRAGRLAYVNVAGALGVGTFWVGFVGLLGYLYGAPLLYGGRIIPVALSTALTLAALGLALVTHAGPRSWPMRLFVGPGAAARMHRTFLPLTAGAVLMTGAVHHLVAARYGVHAAVIGAVSAAATVLVTSVAVGYVARWVGGAIDRAETQLKEAHVALEDRVRERTHALAAANDELQRTEAGLRQAKLAAERASVAKNEFISRMSHDLRTPLNAILGFAQVLEIEPDAERTEPVRQILNGGRYLLDLINEVLDIARIEAGQLSLSTEPVLVSDVVTRAVELVKPLATHRAITLSVEPFGNTDAVTADRQRLSQVLLNLLSNALKYNSDGGRVTVHMTRMPPDRYRIAVTDTGAGIPAAKLQLLFQPFQRLGAEASGVEGTGLGLAVSRALAEAMGGTIGVNSVVDRGSTFWVELAQATYGSVAESSVAPVTSHGTRARRGTVLYVEDNLPNVRLMERILGQRPGVVLQHAALAEAGFTMIRARRPDVVLLDLHLPDMSGEDMLRRLWQDPVNRTIPTIMVTADATPSVARRLKAAGARTVLTKPLDIRQVLRVVDELLADRTDIDDGRPPSHG